MKKIELNAQEASIFKALLDFNEHTGRQTAYRVAGGWVRDRLLGLSSDDLDIALSDCTGKQFADAFVAYAKGNPTLRSQMGRVYVVSANADRSKHLETVGVEIFGQKIDFVNLRSETYGDSRIPTMEMGTAETDAQRRDLTVNSLYLNINTGEIEDHVGGLKDLENMVLRTPLDPRNTFLDDPLRVLRAVRFFSRFEDATLSQDILDAMALPEVQDAFKSKVSAERAAPEILKLLAGKRPVAAFRVLFDTGFDKAMFVGEYMEGVDLRIEQKNRHHRFTVLEHTLQVMENIDRLLKGESDQVRTRMLLAALFHDFGKAVPGIAKPKVSDPNQMAYKGHEDVSAVIAEAWMKAIGIPKEERDFVVRVVEMHMRVHTESWSKRSIGKFIRDSEIPGQDPVWKYVHLHGVADAQAKGTGDPKAETEQKMGFLRQFEEFRAALGKDKVPKPMVNGFLLMSMFPDIKPNKVVILGDSKKNFISFISDRLLDEQADGKVADKDQAIVFVESMRGEVESLFKAFGL